MRNVEAVMINCHRRGNIVRILEAIRPQVQLTTVLDCSVDGGQWTADRTIRFTPKERDAGPWTRYAVSGLYEQEFTLLLDDDLLPNADMVSRFMEYSDRYDLVCGVGRLLATDGGYNPRNSPAGEAHIAVRCYFWRTAALRETVPKAMSRFALAERWHDDDITMCFCLRKAVFVLPGKPPWSELPCSHAISSKPGHIARRDALCRRMSCH